MTTTRTKLQLKPKAVIVDQVKAPPVAAPAVQASEPGSKTSARKVWRQQQAELHAKVAALAGLPENMIRQPARKAKHRRDLAWALIHLNRINEAGNYTEQPWFAAFTLARAGLLETLEVINNSEISLQARAAE